MSGLKGQCSWVDSWSSVHSSSAVWWAQACKDMPDSRPNQEQMSWLRKSGYFRWQPLIKISMYEWQNLSGGLNLPVPTLCNIFPILAFHPLHLWTPNLESHIFYNFFDLRIFTTPQGLMSGFIFFYTPQILRHFHFISNPISTLLFVSFSFTWLLSLTWIFTIFQAREARLGTYVFVHLQSG